MIKKIKLNLKRHDDFNANKNLSKTAYICENYNKYKCGSNIFRLIKFEGSPMQYTCHKNDESI